MAGLKDEIDYWAGESVSYGRARQRGDLLSADAERIAVEQALDEAGEVLSREGAKVAKQHDAPWVKAEIYLLRCILAALLVVVGVQMYIRTTDLQRAPAQEVTLEVPADDTDQ